MKSKYIIAILITVFLMTLLLMQVSISDILMTISRIDLLYLAYGFICYVIQYGARAFRLKLLLYPDNPGGMAIFNMVSIHNFLNHILPARLGEGSYLWLMNRYGNIPMTRCVSSLVVARIFDLISVIAFFIVGFGIIGFANANNSIWPLVFALVFLLIMILGLHFSEALGRIVIRYVVKVTGGRYAWVGGIERILVEITSGVAATTKRGLFFRLLGVSGLVWLANIYMFQMLLVGMGFHVPLVKVLLGATGAALTNILPINGFGSFGTMEAGWTIAFLYVGLSKDDAICSGFSIHIIALFFAAILALLGYIKLLRSVSSRVMMTEAVSKENQGTRS